MVNNISLISVRLIKYFGSIIILLTYVASSFAADYYVDINSGNDTNSGAISSPWKNISKAKKSAGTVQPGDTIFIRSGSYPAEVFTSSDGGSLGLPITYKRYGTESVVFNSGGANVIHTAGANFLIFDGLEFTNHMSGITIESNDVTVQNCIFHNGVGLSEGDITVIYRNTTYGVPKNITLQNNTIYDNGTVTTHHGIYIASVENILVENNEIWNISGSGILVQPHDYSTSGGIKEWVKDATISKNKVHNNSGGISVTNWTGTESVDNIIVKNNLVYDNAQGYGVTTGISFFYNNTVFNNASAGISIKGGQVSIQNNILYGNGIDGSWGAADIKFASYSITLSQVGITDNLLGIIASSHINIGGILTQVNNDNQMATDPLFVSTVSTESDFLQLQSSSPAIDQGLNLSSAGVTDDFFGNPRSDGAYDIGAHEYTSAPADTTPPAAPTGLTIQQ